MTHSRGGHFEGDLSARALSQIRWSIFRFGFQTLFSLYEFSNIRRADGRCESNSSVILSTSSVDLGVGPPRHITAIQTSRVSQSPASSSAFITSTSRGAKLPGNGMTNTKLPKRRQQWEDRVPIPAGERLADIKASAHLGSSTMLSTSALRRFNKRIVSNPDTSSSSRPMHSIARILIRRNRGESGSVLSKRLARYRANEPGGIPTLSTIHMHTASAIVSSSSLENTASNI